MRTHPIVLTVAVVAVLTGACGDDDTEGSSAPAVSAPAGQVTDACGLLGPDALGSVLGGEVPTPQSQDYGAGFIECEWELGDRSVLVSVVPAENFRSDYVDQLNLVSDFDGAGLPEGAVAFPGLVGIGRASADGAGVGFPHGTQGILVSIGTPDRFDDATLRAVVDLARTVG